MNKKNQTSEQETVLTPGQRSWIRAKHHSGLQFGFIVVSLMILIAVFAPLITPHDPYLQNIAERLIPPVWDANGSWENILGTDQLGRDYLSRLIYGAQISLSVGFGAASIGAFIGVGLGLLAGYYGGRVDRVISFLRTCQLSLPSLLVAMAVVFFVGASVTTVIIVLGCFHWTYYLVVVKSVTRQIRNMEYVGAAKSIGSSDKQIIFYEILPNLLTHIIVIFTLEMAMIILVEAALSFLGVGVQPPDASWGLMISEGKAFMFFKPWLVAIPGAALFLLVLSINLLGDGIRDVTAPEHRN